MTNIDMGHAIPICDSIPTVATMVEALAKKEEIRIFLDPDHTDVIEGDIARFFCIGYVKAWKSTMELYIDIADAAIDKT